MWIFNTGGVVILRTPSSFTLLQLDWNFAIIDRLFLLYSDRNFIFFYLWHRGGGLMWDFNWRLLGLWSLLGALIIGFWQVGFLLLLLFLLLFVPFQLFVLLSCESFSLFLSHFHPYRSFFLKVLFAAMVHQCFIHVHFLLVFAGINNLKSSKVALFVLFSLFLMFGNHFFSFLAL